MKEYIDREAFIKLVEDIPMWGSVAAMLASTMPTANVVEVPRQSPRRLYKALFRDSPNNSQWKFKPADFSELMFILNFLANEHDEDEKGREMRVMALLNGETVCTNLAAFKLVENP